MMKFHITSFFTLTKLRGIFHWGGPPDLPENWCCAYPRNRHVCL